MISCMLLLWCGFPLQDLKKKKKKNSSSHLPSAALTEIFGHILAGWVVFEVEKVKRIRGDDDI